jgi:hypothetical protein
MTVVQGYTQSVLAPQLESLGLTQRQREIVVNDVTERLESLLSHWSDVPFRRAVLAMGTEEASFWEPRNASIEIRSLAVVAVRNSLVTDLNASRAYTKTLRSQLDFCPFFKCSGRGRSLLGAMKVSRQHRPQGGSCVYYTIAPSWLSSFTPQGFSFDQAIKPIPSKPAFGPQAPTPSHA